MDEKDPMEIERERENRGEWEPDAALVPGAGASSLEDPDAAEEDVLDENVDDEREAGV